MRDTNMTQLTRQALRSVKIAGIASLTLACSVIGANAMLPTPTPEATNINTSANAGIRNKIVAALVTTNPQGQQALQPINATTSLKRGDIIEYRSYLTNVSNHRVDEMTATMSIPDEVSLLGDVMPSTVSASLDGVRFNYMPLQGQINGQIQAIPLEYYKQLRWTIKELGVNETAMVKYRAVVR